MTLRDSLAWLSAHKLAGLITLALAVAVIAVARYTILGKPVDTYTATRSDLVQSVVSSGRVISPRRVSIAAEVTGRVAHVRVEEGVRVRRGEVLVELDQSDEQAAVAQARAALAQAEARVRQIAKFALPSAEQALRQAEANLTQARLAYQRTQALIAKGFVSRAQLDDVQRNLDVAESQVRTAQLQVETESAGGSDHEVTQMARREAETAVRVAQAKLDATIILAPTDGTLIGRSVEPGDVAQPGKELLLLATSGETQVIVDIDEKNLGKLAIGQKALVSADAFPDQTFAAELFYINPGVDPVRGAVEAKLRVPQPPTYLRQDMTVSVDIEVGRRKDVVTAPADAIHDASSDHPWVLAVSRGRTVKQPVKLGMRGDAAVEVIAGVTPGDALVPATNGVVMAGQRVRPIALQPSRR
jgi:HlyD family secretion protein